MQQQPGAITQDLALVGGGHAPGHMLKSSGMRPLRGVRVTLIARDVETPYSGMLLGWVAGHYQFEDCHIKLGRLARFAGARLIHEAAIGADRGSSHVICRDHPPIRWDFLSLDIGSVPRADNVPDGPRAGVPPGYACDCLYELRQLGHRAAVIGRLDRASGAAPLVRLAMGAAADAIPEPVAAA
jgi:selenide, water dikinase